MIETPPRRVAALVLTGVTVATAPHFASAGTIRHDRSDIDYRNLANQPQFDAVGRHYADGAFCSFTLIAPTWALTAAHCIDRNANGQLDDDNPANHRFNVGGQESRGVEFYVPELWNGDINNGGDLALVRLDAPITSVTPATIYTNFQDLGKTLVPVGYGRTGTGKTGASGSLGTKRAGQNLADDLYTFDNGATALRFDFDEPAPRVSSNVFGSSTPLDLEYLIGPGDSGGGSFLFEDGAWYVAGVHSGTYDFYNYPGATTNRATYGDGALITRVAPYQHFIASTIASAVPEPASLTLLALGTVFTARRSRVS